MGCVRHQTARLGLMAVAVLALAAACSQDRRAPLGPSGDCKPLSGDWWLVRENQSPRVLLSPDGQQMAWRRRTPQGGAHWCVGPAGAPEQARRYNVGYAGAGWTNNVGLMIGEVQPRLLKELTEPGLRGFADFLTFAQEQAEAATGEAPRRWRSRTAPNYTGMWMSVMHGGARGETVYFQSAPASEPLHTLSIPTSDGVDEVLPLAGGGIAVVTLDPAGDDEPVTLSLHSAYGPPAALGEFETPRLKLAGWASQYRVYLIDERSQDQPRLMELFLQTGAITPVDALGDTPAYNPVVGRDGALLAVHSDGVQPRPVGVVPAVSEGVALIEAQGLSTTGDLSLHLSDTSRASGRALFRRVASNGTVTHILTDARQGTAREFTFMVNDTPLEPYSTARIEAIAADGRPVPAILHQPAALEAGAPLVVSLHGGPTAHDPMEATIDREVYLRRGLAVLAVNYRGSTGHGRDHLNAGWDAFDSGMVEDVTAAIDEALSHVGPRPVLLTGGSFGARLAFATARVSDVPVCAVIALLPAADLLSFLEDGADRHHRSVLKYWERLYGPWTEPDAANRLRAASAVTRPTDWTIPVAVIAAENDTVTPPEMAERLARAYEDVLFTPYTVIPDAEHSPEAHQFIPVLERTVDTALDTPCAP